MTAPRKIQDTEIQNSLIPEISDIQNMHSIHPDAFQVLHQSSIEKTKEKFSMERPGEAPFVLEPPLKTCAQTLVDIAQKFEKTMKDQGTHLDEEFDEDCIRLQEVREKKRLATEENKRFLDAKTSISRKMDILSYFTNGASFALALMTSGPAALLSGASALLGITNKIFGEFDVHRKISSLFSSNVETQKKYAQVLKTGLDLISLGTGVLGGLRAFSAGRNIVGQAIAKTMSTTGSVAHNVLSMGGAYNTKKFIETNSIMQKADLTRRDLEFKQKIDMEALQKMSNVLRSLYQQVKEMLSGIDHSTRS